MSTSSAPVPAPRDGPAIPLSSPLCSPPCSVRCLARMRLCRSAFAFAPSGHAGGGTALPGRYVHVPDPSSAAARTGIAFAVLDVAAAAAPVPMGACAVACRVGMVVAVELALAVIRTVEGCVRVPVAPAASCTNRASAATALACLSRSRSLSRSRASLLSALSARAVFPLAPAPVAFAPERELSPWW